MKLSIWQQFSSNHSASYMIVGVFDDEKTAQTAGEKTLKIIKEIREWYLSNDMTNFGWKLNPIEEKYAKEYDIEWKAPVDWLRAYPDEKNFIVGAWYPYTENLVIYDKCVVVKSPMGDSTWQVGHQFVNLFKTMGAKTYSQSDYGHLPDDNRHTFFATQVTIVCEAPSDKIASMIANHINTPKSVPWAVYHPFYSRIIGDSQKQNTTTNTHNHDDVSQNTESNISYDDAKDKAMEFILYDLDLAHITATISGSTVTIIDYNSRGICLFLSAFVRWAKDQGCKVDYSFEQTRGYDDL